MEVSWILYGGRDAELWASLEGWGCLIHLCISHNDRDLPSL